MCGRFEVVRWFELGSPAYAVAVSADDQFVAAGAERGVTVWHVAGPVLLRHPQPPAELPAHQICATADFNRLFVCISRSHLARLDLRRAGEALTAQLTELYTAEADVHSLSASADGTLIAVGHLSPAMAVLQPDGTPLWRRHPATGTATEGHTWRVSLDPAGHTLYVGSSSGDTLRLAALDPQSGRVVGHARIAGHLAALAALPDDQGMAVALMHDPFCFQLICFDRGLKARLCERVYAEPVTALAAAPQGGVLAAAIGYEGRIEMLEAGTGGVLATEWARSVVNGLALNRNGLLAAAVADGSVLLLRYVAEEFRL